MRTHGWYENVAFDNVLYSRLYGAWNVECAMDYSKEIREAAVKLTAPWAHIVDARGWALAVPEAGHHLRDLSVWRFQQGMRALAYFGDGNELNVAFARGNLNEGMNAAFFVVGEELAAWLAELDFTLHERIHELLAAP